ncbi:MAG: spore coat protein [Clostridiaceae bacterium]|nr:spore coat protein [Clostridiaceae bacterium]MDD6274406.1 spore coat protein [Clostridiaceae bacterium]
MANNVINMSERDILDDFLSSQKFIADTYNTWAGECVNANLRDDFLCILKEEHDIQSELFTEMQNHGWYQTKPVEQTELDKLRQKFGCC